MKNWKLFALLLVLLAAFTAPLAAQETTLLVWDSFVRDVENSVIETLIAEFEAAHPGVTVERVPKAYDDVRATAGLAFSSDDGPDVSQINQGRVDMGPLIEAGLLLDLTPYAEQYGWTELISPGIIARNSFTPDGQTFGEGNLYGVPVTAELIGVYYNEQIFADLGLTVPTTFAEFEETLAAVSEAGIVPIVFGNLDGWPAIHTFGEVQNLNLGADRAYLDDFIFGRNNVSFDVEQNVAAAAKVQEWVEAGFFTPQFEGIGYDDSWRLFIDGQGAMMLTGSWISGEIAASENPDNFGFFILPGNDPETPKVTIGGSGYAFSIRSGSTKQDLAAEYIDWMFSERAAELWIEAGVVPLRPVDASLADEDTLFGQVLLAWNQLNSTDTVGHYLDWASPTMYNTITASLQELLALRVDPAGFAQAVEADYAAYLAEQE